jgi:sugar phosphate isomerase/epimerase
MEIGIFAKTFVRPTLEEVLEAISGHGLAWLQFNMACAGLPSLPEVIAPELCDQIRYELAVRGLRMAAISGSFNMIHPDPEKRRDGLRRLEILAAACARLGTSTITLCTGTRDPDNMWRHHPDNGEPEAWRDLITSMAEALQIAETHRVTLAFEPEVSNVVDSAAQGRRLLAEMQSPRLKVVMDGANLFHSGDLPRMRDILDEAFDLLGPEIVLAHAKDLSRDGVAGDQAAGTGLLDYDYYLALLDAAGFDGPLLLHSLAENQVAASVSFLRGKLGVNDSADAKAGPGAQS